jgi:hypothetical protein
LIVDCNQSSGRLFSPINAFKSLTLLFVYFYSTFAGLPAASHKLFDAVQTPGGYL